MFEQGIRRPYAGLKVIVASAALLCLPALVAAPAQAQTTVASCAGTGVQGTTLGLQEVAQTFTVPSAVNAIGVRVAIGRGGAGTGTFRAELFLADSAGPTGTALATGAINYEDAPLSSSNQPVTFSFAAPAPLTAGQVYAVVLSRTGTGSGTIGTLGTNPCPIGNIFWRSDSTDTTWTSSPDEDVVPFEVLGPSPEPQPEPEPSPPAPEPQSGPKADGTLTIDANKGKVEKGRKVTLTGQLDVAANEACEPGRQIQIQRRLKSEDDSKFTTFETVQTETTGNYSLKTKVNKTYFYRAVVGETDACDDETSNSQKVRVQKKKAAQEA